MGDVARRCLACSDVHALGETVLARYEAAFGRELVQQTFSFIVVSRFGLSEEELLALLTCSQLDEWSPMYHT